MFLQFKDNFVRGQNKSDNLICRCYKKANRDYVNLVPRAFSLAWGPAPPPSQRKGPGNEVEITSFWLVQQAGVELIYLVT